MKTTPRNRFTPIVSQRSLVGYSPQGRKESDMTSLHFKHPFIDKTFNRLVVERIYLSV